MCVVSAVGDDWNQTFPDKYRWYPNPQLPVGPNPLPVAVPTTVGVSPTIDLSQFATKEQIEELRNDMKELKELLRAAIKYDAATGQPNCEIEDKIALIKDVAKAVGVDLSDLNLT